MSRRRSSRTTWTRVCSLTRPSRRWTSRGSVRWCAPQSRRAAWATPAGTAGWRGGPPGQPAAARRCVRGAWRRPTVGALLRRRGARLRLLLAVPHPGGTPRGGPLGSPPALSLDDAGRTYVAVPRRRPRDDLLGSAGQGPEGRWLP